MRAGQTRIGGPELFMNQVCTFIRRRWNFTKRNNYLMTLREERAGYALKWVEELKNMCFTEAEKAKQLRSEELSTQKEESKSTANQLMVQNQEFQDKVYFLNVAREFYDPETASSSGLSHVPSQPVSIPSPRGLTSRDSCLQPDTQNSLGMSRTVLKTCLPSSEKKMYGISTVRARVSQCRETCRASK